MRSSIRRWSTSSPCCARLPSRCSCRYAATIPEYVEANRLLSFLQWFRPAPADPVPDNSILREFIGNSILENFRLWTR